MSGEAGQVESQSKQTHNQDGKWDSSTTKRFPIRAHKRYTDVSRAAGCSGFSHIIVSQNSRLQTNDPVGGCYKGILFNSGHEVLARALSTKIYSHIHHQQVLLSNHQLLLYDQYQKYYCNNHRHGVRPARTMVKCSAQIRKHVCSVPSRQADLATFLS